MKTKYWDTPMRVPTGSELRTVGPWTSRSTSQKPVAGMELPRRFIRCSFSFCGGVNLYVATSANVTVTNCKFGTTASSVPSAAVVQVLPDSPGFAFKYNVIDGGGALGPGTSLFSDLGGGNVTIKYNWVKNAPGGAISLGGNTVLDLRYNLFENAGRQYPEHTNYLQWSDPSITYSALVEFNTTYQQIVSPTAPGEAFQFYDNWSGGTLSSATFAYNTLVTDPTNSNATVHQTSHSYHVGDTITVAGVKAYFFCTGAGTSAASTPGAYARWSMGAPVTDGGATFYGGNQASSYLLHGTSADYSTTVTGPATIHDNYFDAKTAYGVFYPNSFNGWTLSGNYDMTTGMNLTVGGIRLKNR